MKQSFRIPSIVLVLGLLIAAFGVGSVLAKQADRGGLGQLDSSYAPAQEAVDLDDGQVEWSTAGGDELDFIVANATAVFFINDDALETQSGVLTRSWLNLPTVDANTVFNIATGTIGDVAMGTGAYAGSRLDSFDQGNYSTSNPGSTPLVEGSVKVAGHFPVIGADPGTFTLLQPASGTVSANFRHHTVDVWAGTDSDNRRAKVTSTSDPQGEWVSISEVEEIGSSTPHPTMKVFRGEIELSDDAGAQGTNGDGVWVQDGDTLTVRYVDSDGDTVDSDTITVDDVAPTIGSISHDDGSITSVGNPTFSFESVDTGSGIATDGSGISIEINGDSANSYMSTQGIVDGLKSLVATRPAWSTLFGVDTTGNDPFDIVITATDVAGNTATTDLELTIDQSRPVMTGAETGISWDRDDAEEGSATDSVKVTFNEVIDASSVSGDDFTVGGSTPTSAAVGTTDTKDDDGNVTDTTKDQVYLTLSAALGPDEKPDVVVTGEILDLAGNKVDVGADAATLTALDGIAPSVTVGVSHALAVDEDEVMVSVETDERLPSEGLIVSINGPNATDVGMIDTSSPAPLKYEGDYTVGSTTSTGAYGVSVQVTDRGGNDSSNLKSASDEELEAGDITVAGGSTTVTVANGPIGDSDFDGDVDADDISALMIDGVDHSGDITGVDASARTITLGGMALSGAAEGMVSYKYTEAVFEVDLTDPTVTIEPAEDEEIQDVTPFIRLIFGEDEYPGDSFKTVTLTKAELTHPDGTVEDVMEGFVSTDWIEYLWAAPELALGEYTITVSGEDAALNSIDDASSTFKIVEKAPFEVSLRPGWNLVSIPGAPADPSVSAVVNNDDVTAVVTLEAGGWATALRDPATGMLDGNLTAITGATAFWVETASFEPLKIDIPGLQPGRPTLPPSFNLAAGWNLVPVVTLNPDTTMIAAEDYFSGLRWSRAYGYDSVTGEFVGMVPFQGEVMADGTDTRPMVEVGKGYYVYLSEAGTLVP